MLRRKSNKSRRALELAPWVIAILLPCLASAQHLLAIPVGGQWQTVDHGRVRVLPFMSISRADHQFHAGGKWELIDDAGHVVVPATYDDARDMVEGLAAVRQSKKWGFVDAHGSLRIPAVYDSVTDFSNGLASVTLDSHVQVIDKNGHKVFDSPGQLSASGFSNGLAAFSSGGLWGYLDRQGKVVVHAKYQSAYPFSRDSLALVELVNSAAKGALTDRAKLAFIDRSGKEVISRVSARESFHDGIAYLRGQLETGPARFIDRAGKVVLTLDPSFEYLDSSESLLRVKNSEGWWAYLATDGHPVLYVDHVDEAFPYSDGQARFRIGRLYGFMDKSGNIMVEAYFDNAEDYHAGFARASIGGTVVFLNDAGKVIWSDHPLDPDAGGCSTPVLDQARLTSLPVPASILTDSPEAMAKHLAPAVQQILGSHFLQEPTVEIVDRAALRSTVKTYLARWHPSFASLNLLVQELGLMHSRSDLLDSMSAYRVNTLPAFYSPGDKRIYLAKRLTPFIQQLALVNTLSLALYDQAHPISDANKIDVSVQEALREGAAALSTGAYLTHLELTGIQFNQNKTSELSSAAALPEFTVELSSRPALLGAWFLSRGRLDRLLDVCSAYIKHLANSPIAYVQLGTPNSVWGAQQAPHHQIQSIGINQGGWRLEGSASLGPATTSAISDVLGRTDAPQQDVYVSGTDDPFYYTGNSWVYGAYMADTLQSYLDSSGHRMQVWLTAWQSTDDAARFARQLEGAKAPRQYLLMNSNVVLVAVGLESWPTDRLRDLLHSVQLTD
jgi:hypothetical protein